MFSHIVVAVALDQDQDPQKALAAARALSAPAARVTLLHVMADVPYYAISYMPEGYASQLRGAIEAELTQLAAGFEHGTVKVLEGDAGREIIDWAKENGADCIVISSHRPAIRDVLLGNTAARVVRHAPCSVFVLREEGAA